MKAEDAKKSFSKLSIENKKIVIAAIKAALKDRQ